MKDDKTTTIVLAVLCFAPFFLSFGSTETVSVNGVITECTSLDFLAIGAGAVAVLLGFMAVVKSGEGSTIRPVGVVALLLGGYHIVSGLGVIGGCG